MGKGIGALAGLGAVATGLAHGVNTGLEINKARRADVFADMMKGIMSDDDDAYNVAAAHFGMPLRKKKVPAVPGVVAPAVETPSAGAAVPADATTPAFSGSGLDSL